MGMQLTPVTTLYSACPETSFPNVSVGNPCLYLSKNTGFPLKTCGNDGRKYNMENTIYSRYWSQLHTHVI